MMSLSVTVARACPLVALSTKSIFLSSMRVNNLPLLSVANPMNSPSSIMTSSLSSFFLFKTSSKSTSNLILKCPFG